jgi:glycosyltransferase involved in cell wall biosynthesis
MRIVLVNPLLSYVRGGAEVNDMNLGDGFVQEGHRLSYLVGRDSFVEPLVMPHLGEIVERPLSKKLMDIALRYSGLPGKVARQFLFRYFVHEVSKNPPDCLKLADLVLLTGRPALSRLKSLTSAPVIQSVRGKLSWFNDREARRADGLIFWGGCEADNPSYLPRGRPWLALDPTIEEDIFYPAKSDPKVAREMRQGDSSALILINVGRLEEVKNVDMLIRSTARAVEKGFNVRLILVGDGTKRFDYESLGQQLLPGRVQFYGFQSRKNLGHFLRAADVFVHAAQVENHPIAIKEAIACGLFVVASRTGRIPNIIKEDRNGFLFPPGDQESLDRKIIKSLELIKSGASSTNSEAKIERWPEKSKKIIEWCNQSFMQRS